MIPTDTTDTTPTALETFNSLTGWDEIAVGNAFGSDITTLRKRPLMFLRSLVFVHLRRTGLSDAQAKRAAMDLAMGPLQTYFPPEPEADPLADPDEDPETPEGKEPSAPR